MHIDLTLDFVFDFVWFCRFVFILFRFVFDFVSLCFGLLDFVSDFTGTLQNIIVIMETEDPKKKPLKYNNVLLWKQKTLL